MQGIIDQLQIGLQQGIIWAILVIGVYISFRILDVADLSIEGTFPLGGCIAAILIFAGVSPIIATICAFIGGCVGGLLTGFLHTKLKIPAILSGIITMTALSSINLVILGFSSSNVNAMSTLPIDDTIYTLFNKWLKPLYTAIGIQTRYGIKIVTIIVSGLILAIVSGLIYWLFGTEIGMSVRATGNNQKMARAQGIDTDFMIILGLMLSNGLIALSGALFAQDASNAMTESGRGAIVIGLAAIILGEIIFGRKRSFKVSLISIIVGAIIFFIIKQFAIYLRVDHYLNLLIAIMLAIILAFPLIRSKLSKKAGKKHA